LGYPDVEDEIGVLRPGARAGAVQGVPTVTNPDDVARSSALLRHVHVAESLLRYIRAFGAMTRSDPRLRLGASTRGLRSLVRCAQAYAAANGRHYVTPADLHRLAEPVLAHRMLLTREAQLAGARTADVVADALAAIQVPRPAAD
jgi:MoxR-like ATPase